MANVDYGMLEKEGKLIRDTIADEYKRGYDALFTVFQNTSKHWTGNAADSFRKAVAGLEPKFKANYEKLLEFGKSVKAVGTSFRTIDSTKYTLK